MEAVIENEISTWFNSWDRLLSIGLSCLAVYIGIVVLVRISGKRTTSQMNNFDWIITVALGGLVTSGILLKNVSVSDALFAATCLILLQWIMTSVVLRSKFVCRLVKAEPKLLVDKGEMLHDNMKHERISEAEILSALRENGLHQLDQAQWVILETDASFSVIAANDDRPLEPQILSNVAGKPEPS